MSSMYQQLLPEGRAGGAPLPAPPLPVLLQLATLVLVLAVEVGKGYLAACFENTKERFTAYPRAGAAKALRAAEDSIKKE